MLSFSISNKTVKETAGISDETIDADEEERVARRDPPGSTFSHKGHWANASKSVAAAETLLKVTPEDVIATMWANAPAPTGCKHMKLGRQRATLEGRRSTGGLEKLKATTERQEIRRTVVEFPPAATWMSLWRPSPPPRCPFVTCKTFRQVFLHS